MNQQLAKKDFYNDTDVQTLLDEAVLHAIALGRPFEDWEVFGFIWDIHQVELVPQMDRRFVLLQEATGTTERVWGVRPDPTGLRASVDAYLEQIIIQRGLVQFFQAASEYTNKHLLGPDDMFVRGTCGHRYITQYVNRADLLAKLGRACPKCLPREKESLVARDPDWARAYADRIKGQFHGDYDAWSQVVEKENTK